MKYRASSAIALTLSLFLPLIGQQPAGKPPDVTFKAGTEFVQVPVIVQKDGRHLPGLAKEAFTLKQDGKDQPIASFEEIVVRQDAATKETFDNVRRADSEHVIIIAVDTINTPVLDQSFFKAELVEYLASATPSSTTYGLVQLTRSGIQVLHDFTSDPKSVLRAVKEQDPSSPTSNKDGSALIARAANEAAQAEPGEGRVEAGQRNFDNVALIQENETKMLRFQDRASRIDTVRTLQQLAQALKGIPGRKALVWVGSGMQFMGGLQEPSRIIETTYNPGRVGEAMDMQLYTWKLLNDANVAVYPIDARRTVNTAYEVMDTSRKYSALASEKELANQTDREIVGTFLAFASQTGGKPCVYRTDLKNCVKEAIEDGKAYYLLGFYVDKKNSTPGWHKLSVKVDQKASVHHRAGFIITRDGPETKRMSDLQLAMSSPFPFTALPFSGRFTGIAPAGKQQMVSYELRIPPDAITLDENKINFDVVAVVRSAGGKEAGRMAQRIERQLPPQGVAEIRTNGIHYRNKIELPAGEYGVWFVLRDNPTGRTGSVTVPLSVK